MKGGKQMIEWKERLLELAIKGLEQFSEGEMISPGYYMSSDEEAELVKLMAQYNEEDDD